MLGSTDDDIFLASNLYAGAGDRRTFAYLQSTMEGRNSYTTNKWDGIVGSARITMYQRLMGSHTLVGSVDWAGIWNQRVPVQLPLGELDGGVRGYHSSPDAGNIRFVSRLEDRWYLGKIRDQADVGMAVFGDAGRVWQGDAPLGYGVTTPLKFGAGLGVLVAVPPGLEGDLPARHCARAIARPAGALAVPRELRERGSLFLSRAARRALGTRARDAELGVQLAVSQALVVAVSRLSSGTKNSISTSPRAQRRGRSCRSRGSSRRCVEACR